MTEKIGVIVVAAGSGTRLGAATPKAFAMLRGTTILERALEGIFGSSEPAQIVVVAPQSHLAEAREISARVAGVAAASISVVVGGDTRQRSVAAGLAALGESVQVVLVHDAARALTPSAVFDRVVAAVTASMAGSGPADGLASMAGSGPADGSASMAGSGPVNGLASLAESGPANGLASTGETGSGPADALASTGELGNGVIPCLPVTDTIKRVRDDSADVRTVEATVDRSDLVHVQTPQGFPRALLDAAYAEAEHEYTDDAALFAAAGHAVEVVPGDALSFKITTPWDLRRAEAVLGEAVVATDIRAGVGMDVHQYDAAEPLWLGGLYWPDEVGLSGHSDGDAMCHAICDALLSAAGLGDIGGRFGTDDPRFAGAHGDVFITETVSLVAGAGFAVGNVSVQLIAKHPRLGARRTELESHLSALVGAPVSVAATTTDGLGFTGRGEGVAVIATALVRADR